VDAHLVVGRDADQVFVERSVVDRAEAEATEGKPLVEAAAVGKLRAVLGAADVERRETRGEVLQRSRLPKLARSLFCAALVNETAGEPEASAWRFLEASWACDDRSARAQARICRERAPEMFGRALETGETERPAAVMHTLLAEVWRRAGRFDEALEACAAAETELGPVPDETDDDGERAGTATVAAFVRNLAAR
jgi:hypothetical protein